MQKLPALIKILILKKWEQEEDGFHCDELRWVRHDGQAIPNTKIKARHYYLSPHEAAEIGGAKYDDKKLRELMSQ